MLFGTEAAELKILDWIQTNMQSDIMDGLMVKITTLGNAGFIWICVALLLIAIPKYRKDGYRLALGLIIGLILGIWLMKNAIARLRPCTINTMVNLLISRPSDYSFPSGHTIASFVSVFFLFKARKWMGWAALFPAIMIAFSRMYLYVHFPSDILGGIVFAYIIFWIVNKIEHFKRERHGL